MDIPSINVNLAKAPSKIEQDVPVVDLKHLLNRGRATHAQVVQSLALTPDTLRSLLAQLTPESPIYAELARLKSTQTVSTSSQITPSLKQNNANQHALVKLLVLSENTPQQKATGWALSPTTLKLGEKISITLTLKHEWVFSRATELQKTAISNNQQTFVKTHERHFSPSARASSLRQSVESSLRIKLPEADKNIKLLNHLLQHTLQSSPQDRSTIDLAYKSSDPILQKLAPLFVKANNWSEKLSSLAKLDPNMVRQSFFQSGIFLEPSIKNTLINQGAPTRSDSSENTGFNVATDFKSLLLLLSNINQQLIEHSTAQPPNKLVDGLVRVFLTALTGLSQKDMPNRDEIRQQLAELNKQLVALQSNISVNQLATLQAALQEPPQINLHTDLFFRLFDTLVPVRLIVDREGKNQNEKYNANQNEKKRNWRFYLDWSFEAHGQFNVEIKLNDERLRYRIWVQNQLLRDKMKSEVHTLIEQFENKHFVVDSFQFVDDAFIKEHHRIEQSHHLIDVRT